MDDSELQAIRAARLQEMQRNSQGGGNPRNAGGEGSKGPSNANSELNALLTQILDHEAKERLNRVRMVKPERVAGVEQYLVRLYQSGGMRGKVGEDELVELLDKIASEERRNNSTSIKFARREYANMQEESQKQASDSEDDFFDE